MTSYITQTWERKIGNKVISITDLNPQFSADEKREIKLQIERKLYDVFLSPKTDIAKKLVYSGHVNTKLDEHKLIKIIFNGEVDTPIIANIIQDCSILVSIVYADSKTIDGKIYGQIIIKLPYYEKDILKLKTYLELKQYQFEEVLDNEIIRKN